MREPYACLSVVVTRLALCFFSHSTTEEGRGKPQQHAIRARIVAVLRMLSQGHALIALVTARLKREEERIAREMAEKEEEEARAVLEQGCPLRQNQAAHC